MEKTEVLLLNTDLIQNHDYIQTVSNVLRNQEMRVVCTDFWNVPSYIMEAINKKEIHLILIASLPKLQTQQFINLTKQLKYINSNNIPVIAFNETEIKKQEAAILNNSGIGITFSITDPTWTWNTLITYIDQIVNLDVQHLNKIKKISHIGIAVKDLDKSLSFYTDFLGLELEGIETVESEGVKVAFLKIGESTFELLEPLTSASPIQRFLDQRGEGIHHIALEVDQIKKRLEQLKASGIELINEQPKLGANQSQIAFIHPKSTYGVLYELCEVMGEEQ